MPINYDSRGLKPHITRVIPTAISAAFTLIVALPGLDSDNFPRHIRIRIDERLAAIGTHLESRSISRASKQRCAESII